MTDCSATMKKDYITKESDFAANGKGQVKLRWCGQAHASKLLYIVDE